MSMQYLTNLLPDDAPTLMQNPNNPCQLVKVALLIKTGFFWNHDRVYNENRKFNMIASNFF